MTKPQKIQVTVDEMKDHALSHLRRAGYPINQQVSIEVEPKLPIMGFSTTKQGKSVIVVSEAVINTNTFISLLIHELSHIYCMQVMHPSHNSSFITTISSWALHGQLLHGYQESIIQHILNNLMDIYADDIVFEVIDPQQTLNFNELFLQWVHPASTVSDPLEKAWDNANSLVNVAFASATLTRHKIIDTDKKVANAIALFLKSIDSRQAEKFTFFKTFFTYIPKDITDKEFEQYLIKYLSEFMKLVK